MPLRQRDFRLDSSDARAASLLKRAQAGDSDAFARLFDLYAERVFNFMLFHLSEERAAEDLTARVFLKAWNSVPCYEPGNPPFDIWLYMIARQAVIDFARRKGMHRIKEIMSPADKGLEANEHVLPCTKAGEGND